MKRILLFAATNVAILIVLSVTAKLFGLDVYLAERGGSLSGLLGLSAIFGFGGAFISLALSKSMAKMAMGVKVIHEPRDAAEAWLVATVRAHAQRIGVGMPEVGVFDSSTANAFATGARRDRALVTVSSGLLARMQSEEVEAVLGHEMSHVANGDMVTMTLLQGVLNTFVIFLARVLGTVIDGVLRGNQRDERYGPGPFYFLTVIILQVLFGVLATLIVMWFSRRREFRADAGGATLAGRANMISALMSLQRSHGVPLPGQFQAFGIQGGSVLRLFMSHPPIEERIAALRALP
ncbi:MAG TPA: protease HtpX [Steroidobacteraceae bacterium]|nr:protease HtpX [Steroidobacteraceae bacterium]